MTMSPFEKAARITAAMLETGGPGSGPQGGSGEKASSGKSHSVKLPSNRSKLSISQSKNALDQMGFKLGAGKSSLVGGKFVTSYSVTGPDGSTRDVGTDELKDIVYSGSSK